MTEGQGVRDEGQHFSNFGIADWNTWVYGSAVCSATSVENEDLAKLNQLFKTLYAHVCECGVVSDVSDVDAGYVVDVVAEMRPLALEWPEREVVPAHDFADACTEEEGGA